MYIERDHRPVAVRREERLPTGGVVPNRKFSGLKKSFHSGAFPGDSPKHGSKQQQKCDATTQPAKYSIRLASVCISKCVFITRCGVRSVCPPEALHLRTKFSLLF